MHTHPHTNDTWPIRIFPKTLEGSTEGTQTAIQLITCTEYMYSDTLHDNTSQNRGLNTQNSPLHKMANLLSRQCIYKKDLDCSREFATRSQATPPDRVQMTSEGWQGNPPNRGATPPKQLQWLAKVDSGSRRRPKGPPSAASWNPGPRLSYCSLTRDYKRQATNIIYNRLLIR